MPWYDFLHLGAGNGLLQPPVPQVQRGVLTAPEPTEDYMGLLTAPRVGGNAKGTPASVAPVPENASPSGFENLGRALGSQSDSLLGFSAGLLSGGTWGEGMSKGFQNMLAVDAKKAPLALAQQKLQQQQAAQQATATYLRNKGLSEDRIAAAVANPSILSNLLTEMSEKPSLVETTDAQGRKVKVWAKPGQSLDQAAPFGGPEPQARPLTPEEIAAVPNLPRTGAYQRDPTGKIGPIVPPPSSSVTVNNAVNPIVKGIGDQFVEERAAAKGASDEVRTIHQARAELDRGIISGAGADLRLSMAKIGNLFGLDDEKAANTETFRSAVASRVLSAVKGLGSGAGISNADRDFAEKMAGGQIALEPASLRRLLDIGERAARERITRYNTTAKRMSESMEELKPYAGTLGVEAPPEYQTVNGVPRSQGAPARRRYNPATGGFE